MGCTERIGNAIDDAFDVLVDLGHPESQHAKAQLAQPAISPRVVDKLIAVVVAIDLDHQPCIQAGEVGEVRAEGRGFFSDSQLLTKPARTLSDTG